jgi:hypothetical protein
MYQQISRKINNDHLVWFENSNRWLKFEEPAWFVNKLHKKKIDNLSISIKCAKKYKLSQRECLTFVNDVCSGLIEPENVFLNLQHDLMSAIVPATYNFIRYSTHQYIIGAKRISIAYETKLGKYYIHPPLAWLETKIIEAPDIEFEIFNYSGALVLRIKSEPVKTWCFHDFGRLKKRLFINLANAIYTKTDEDWMAFAHASAVTDERQAILLSAESGSGKSSMAALLQKKGLKLVSDDFVPIEAKNKKAVFFPAAISIKEGSFDMLHPSYGNLKSELYNGDESANRPIRYIIPDANEFLISKPLPVKAIIFIQYDPRVSCIFKQVNIADALKLFLKESWVSNDPKHARSFINWFVKLQFFFLEYGDNEKAVNKLLDLFKTREAVSLQHE